MYTDAHWGVIHTILASMMRYRITPPYTATSSPERPVDCSPQYDLVQSEVGPFAVQQFEFAVFHLLDAKSGSAVLQRNYAYSAAGLAYLVPWQLSL